MILTREQVQRLLELENNEADEFQKQIHAYGGQLARDWLQKDVENRRLRKVLEKTKAEIQTAIDDCEMETIRATQHAKFILKLLQIDLADIDAGSGGNGVSK